MRAWSQVRATGKGSPERRLAPQQTRLKATTGVQLDQLSGNIQHLLFISAVPVAYTDLAIVEKGIKLLQKATFLTKTGMLLLEVVIVLAP